MNATTKTNWLFHLYVSGETPKLHRTVALLEQICKENFKGQGDIKVIDVRKNPFAAMEENIIATPTFIKKLPEPVRRIIGELSDKEELVSVLDIIKDE